MSILGDVVYGIALGFWVLAVTGSTALMGGLMAASTLPRVAVSPVAGVVVDRSDRRRLLIWMDVIRGLAVVLVAVEALLGTLQVWMVFAAGIIISACGAFFTPAASSVIPDITGKSKVVQANSVFSMLQAGGNIVGNSAGGVLYQAIGAPILFLFNGISYLFSAANLLFCRIPRIQHESEKSHFLADLAGGFLFVWEFTGLRSLISMAALINFFASIALVLFLPFFQKNLALGPARYGAAMAFFTGGMLVSYLALAVVKVPSADRYRVFVVCGVVTTIMMATFPFVPIFPIVVAMLAVAASPTRRSTCSSCRQCSLPCLNRCGERFLPWWEWSRRGSRLSLSLWAALSDSSSPSPSS